MHRGQRSAMMISRVPPSALSDLHPPLVFLALGREARAEGATRIPPAALGRVLGLDRAPAVKTIRRKLAERAGARQGRGPRVSARSQAGRVNRGHTAKKALAGSEESAPPGHDHVGSGDACISPRPSG